MPLEHLASLQSVPRPVGGRRPRSLKASRPRSDPKIAIDRRSPRRALGWIVASKRSPDAPVRSPPRSAETAAVLPAAVAVTFTIGSRAAYAKALGG